MLAKPTALRRQPMDTIMDYIVQAVLTGIIAIVGWVMKRVVDDIKELETTVDSCRDKNGKNELELSDYKRHVSENYATKTDLNSARQETTASLQRLHDRLDDINENVDRKMDTVIGMLRK